MENTSYHRYVNEIRRYGLLSAEEERVLASQIQKGDKDARIKLVKSNLRLVACLAKKYASSQISIMDLIQEGNLGLMTAATKYTCDFNTRFSTYAYAWILQYILRYIRNKTDSIALPHRKEEQIRALRAARTYLEQKNGRQPTLEELACYISLPVEKIRVLFRYEQPVCSLDSECNEDGDGTIVDMISDDTYQPEEIYLRKEKQACVREMVSKLPERERNIIYRRYNFDGSSESQTLRELSKVMGVSSETVRQIELRAVKKLRAFVESSEIKEVYNA